MAEKSFPGGVMLVYGVAIGGAIARGSAAIEELVALRSHAQAIVDAQGDVASALTALTRKCQPRRTPAQNTSPHRPASASWCRSWVSRSRRPPS
jgi:hypothetical protein